MRVHFSGLYADAICNTWHVLHVVLVLIRFTELHIHIHIYHRPDIPKRSLEPLSNLKSNGHPVSSGHEQRCLCIPRRSGKSYKMRRVSHQMKMEPGREGKHWSQRPSLDYSTLSTAHSSVYEKSVYNVRSHDLAKGGILYKRELE